MSSSIGKHKCEGQKLEDHFCKLEIVTILIPYLDIHQASMETF